MKDGGIALTRATIPTVVDAGTRFDGLVSFQGAVRVEGLLVGQVVANGTLWLAEQGELRGRIEADEVMVEGVCDGEIEARQRIELRPTARVRGRMTAPRVVMADGALFDGQCEVGRAAVAASAGEPAARPVPASIVPAETASISA